MPTVETVLVTGNTFPVKDEIKRLGGRWDPVAKGWRVPKTAESAVRTLIAQAKPAPPRSSPRSSSQPRGGNWAPCGYPGCSRNYGDECDGRGRWARY